MQFIKPLWQHQSKAVLSFKTKKSMGLFFEPGTGKTCTALNMLRLKCNKKGRLLRTIIFCPSIVMDHWSSEILSHTKFTSATHIAGSQKKRIEKVREIVSQMRKPGFKNNILITPWSSAVMKDLMLELTDFCTDFIILDESHKIKDASTLTSKNMYKLARDIEYKLLLSGTPILNSPYDIFTQGRLLSPKLFGTSSRDFRFKYWVDLNGGNPFVNYPQWTLKKGAEKKLQRLINKVSMSVKKVDCVDLPPFTRTRIPFSLTQKQSKAYDDMRKDMIAYIEGEQYATANIALTRAIRLQQIVSGFVVDSENRTLDLVSGFTQGKFNNPRQQALYELLQLSGQSKVLIWAVFHKDYENIRQVCDKLKIGYVEVHGSVKDKSEAVSKFQHDKGCRVYIGHPLSGGIGVNLTQSDISIFYSRGYSLEAELQAKDRNYRIGSDQHKSIQCFDIVAKDTIDELILGVLSDKLKMSKKMLLQQIKEGLKNV